MRSRHFASLLLVSMLSMSLASAEIHLYPFGRASHPYRDPAPPEVIGGFAMTPFPAYDDGPPYELTESVPSPLGGELRFSRPLIRAPFFPGIWSDGHAWMGTTYFDPILPGTVDLIFPQGTRAFYFYAKLDTGSVQRLFVTSETGETLEAYSTMVAGARGFGLFVTEPDETLTYVRVIAESQTFNLGEFGIAIPEPSAALLLLVAGAAYGRRR